MSVVAIKSPLSNEQVPLTPCSVTPVGFLQKKKMKL